MYLFLELVIVFEAGAHAWAEEAELKVLAKHRYYDIKPTPQHACCTRHQVSHCDKKESQTRKRKTGRTISKIQQRLWGHLWHCACCACCVCCVRVCCVYVACVLCVVRVLLFCACFVCLLCVLCVVCVWCTCCACGVHVFCVCDMWVRVVYFAFYAFVCRLLCVACCVFCVSCRVYCVLCGVSCVACYTTHTHTHNAHTTHILHTQHTCHTQHTQHTPHTTHTTHNTHHTHHTHAHNEHTTNTTHNTPIHAHHISHTQNTCTPHAQHDTQKHKSATLKSTTYNSTTHTTHHSHRTCASHMCALCVVCVGCGCLCFLCGVYSPDTKCRYKPNSRRHSKTREIKTRPETPTHNTLIHTRNTHSLLITHSHTLTPSRAFKFTTALVCRPSFSCVCLYCFRFSSKNSFFMRWYKMFWSILKRNCLRS